MVKTTFLIRLLEQINLTISDVICSKSTKKLTLSDTYNLVIDKSEHSYFKKRFYIYPKFEVHLSFEVEQPWLISEYFSLILSSRLNKAMEEYNIAKIRAYKIKFNFKKNTKIENSLKTEKYIEKNEICQENEDINNLDINIFYNNYKKIKKYYRLIIINDKLTIYSKNDLIHEKKFNVKNYFGDYIYIQLIKSLKFKNIRIKDFIICDNINDYKNIRYLQSNDSSINNTLPKESELKYLEIGRRCIESNTNYLRQGNVYLIPSIHLIPKNEDNNLLINIRDKTIYSKRFLKNLINITHSKGDYAKKYISVDKDNKIIVYLESHISGELYVTSSYFKYNNFDKFIIIVKSGKLSLENTFAEINKQPQYIAGNNIMLKIFPKDKYGNLVDDIKDEDFEIFIIFPDNSTSVEKGSYNIKDKIIELNKTLTVSGKTIFKVKYNNNSDIECKNCEIQIKHNEFFLDNIKVNYYKNNSLVELKENQNNIINKSNNLIFELFTYDEYNNIIDDNLNIELVPNFSGLDSNISLCYENKDSIIDIFLCEEENNLRKYYFLINGEYFLEIKYLNQTKNYTLEINGDFSANGASNGKILLSETYFSSNNINGTAGELEEFLIELKSYDGKRNNFWFKNPNEEIILAFKENESCSYNISLGEKPGQYSIMFNCTKKYNENEITLIIQENELNKKVLFKINPNIPAKEIIFDNNNNKIDNYSLPEGYVDEYYIIQLQLLDIYNNEIDCNNNNNLNYRFSNSNYIDTEIYCDMNNTFVMNNSFSNGGYYTLFLISLNKSYSFILKYGNPVISIINFSEQIETGEKLYLSISLTDIKDKKNNTIPIEVFLDNMEIKCNDPNGAIYNFTYNINNNSNILEYTSQDIIKKPLDLKWYFFYDNKSLTYLNEKYITKVIAKTFPANTRLFVNSKSFINESSYLCIAEDFIIKFYLIDQFDNYIEKDNETTIKGILKDDNIVYNCKIQTFFPSLYRYVYCDAPDIGTFDFELNIQNKNNSAYYCCTVEFKGYF